MEYNPYTDRYNQLKETIAKLNNDKELTTQDLVWYYNTDVEKLEQELQQLLSKRKDRYSQVKKIQDEIAVLMTRLERVKSSKDSTFIIINWFSSEQKRYRQAIEELNYEIVSNKEKIKRESTLIDAAFKKATNLEASIYKHKNYDVNINSKYLEELENAIASHQHEFEKLAEDKQRVDLVLSPIEAELKNLELKMQATKALLNTAHHYDSELSKAADSRERAMLHKKCEESLGESSPKKFINQQDRILKQIERDYIKAQNRAREVGHKASRVIDTVIIDGNNMCYEGETFVGLNPLKVVTSELQKQYKVIVVFDSKIRQILKSNNADIAAQFPDNIKLHIVANNQFADATILDLAADHKSTYVISNDRFGDYNDKEVVKSNRLIRHEIVNNRAFIHDLNVNLAYA